LRPHVWQKRGIGKELHLVSSADAVAYAKAIVVKFETSPSDQMEDGFFCVVRHSMDFHHSCNGHRCAPMLLADALQSSISFARAYNARTSQKAELFCEIRMMRPGCGCHRKTCDGRLLLRAFPEIADTTGGRSAQKTNFSIAILLTESLHQFA
jgi:hypothetical protein